MKRCTLIAALMVISCKGKHNDSSLKKSTHVRYEVPVFGP
jgi:hypothetical protein